MVGAKSPGAMIFDNRERERRVWGKPICFFIDIQCKDNGHWKPLAVFVQRVEQVVDQVSLAVTDNGEADRR